MTRAWSLDRVVELTLRPDRFFPDLLRRHGEVLPWAAIWVRGMAGAIDRVDTQMLSGRLTADSAVASSWLALWATVLVAGAVGGPLIWLVGGWWYRVRLAMSGARDVNPRHARLVYLYASLVSAVPGVAWLGLVTVVYPTYHAAYTAGPLGLSLMAMFLWSIWVSYRGVLHCFDVRRGAARVWFLILPMALFGAVSAGVAALAWFGPL